MVVIMLPTRQDQVNAAKLYWAPSARRGNEDEAAPSGWQARAPMGPTLIVCSRVADAGDEQTAKHQNGDLAGGKPMPAPISSGTGRTLKRERRFAGYQRDRFFDGRAVIQTVADGDLDIGDNSFKTSDLL